jgi:hypothetical protein
MHRLFFIWLICATQAVTGQEHSFTFKLPVPATTSAGVYTRDNVLVRTLWNAIQRPAGIINETWDGRDDLGHAVPSGNYHVKLVHSRVKYQWEGTIGNSSDSISGPTKHRGYYHCMRGLAFSGSFGYFCTGYSEGSPSLAKFHTATPNQKIEFFSPKTQTGDINFVAADAKMVYWGAFDANIPKNSFVFATSVSNDEEVKFSAGSGYTVKYGKTYKYALSISNQKANITGLAVQKKGEFLLVARAGIDELQVLNKRTGKLVKTLKFPRPRSICVDNDDNLWMTTGINNVSGYRINSDGTLSPTRLSLGGLEDPVAIQVSPGGKIIAVADGEKSQQVKFYDVRSGEQKSVLGTAGGYFSDATVTDEKFYFNDAVGKRLTFIAYQDDGSFWVGDPGNLRVQHYSADNRFINRIMSLGATYSTWVDKKNIKRLWADYLEFSIDYNAPLSGKTGWKLVKNWGANISAAYDRSEKFRFITTLSNGRTYGFLRNKTGREVVEFPATGQLRFSGITRTAGLNFVMAQDGSLQSFAKAAPGGRSTMHEFGLAGFDAAGNPYWKPVHQVLDTTPVLTQNDPNAAPLAETVTSTDKVIIYVPNAVRKYVDRKPESWLTGYHLGALQKGMDRWLWRTELATNRNYKGRFPPPGVFDIGNGVIDNAGGSLCIVDRNIITSYHGEFWKNAQTNKFNHYLDNGLAIGQFGITRPETNGHAAPGMAGNALTPILVRSTDGNLFLYHGDESDHAGVHRWKITGLKTIREEEIPLKPAPAKVLSRAQRQPATIDLMEGLKYDAVLTNDNGVGWQRSPAEDINQDPYTNIFTVSTNVLKQDRLSSPDVFIKFARDEPVTYHVTRTLGEGTVTRSWTLAGYVAYPNNMPNGQSIFQYLDVLDEKGKLLTTFYVEMNRKSKPFSALIFGNKKLIRSGVDHVVKKAMSEFTRLEITMAGGIATFKYGTGKAISAPVFDPGGNWRKPALLRCRFESIKGGAVYGATLGLKDLTFTRQ